MSKSARHFLDLMDVELDDVCSDLRAMEELLRNRINSTEITNYVYQENNALLELEIACVSGLRTMLKNQSFDLNLGYEATAQRVSELCRAEIERSQMPHVIFTLVDRRLQKLVQFVQSSDPNP